jgi:uncharacterized protein (TIGR00369 family)
MTHDIPADFEPFSRASPLLAPWQPIYERALADRVVLGVRVRAAHTNSRGTVHGGLFAALADQAMGMTCGVQLRATGAAVANLWTTSLTLDCLGSATVGQWLAFDTIFVRCGRTICHTEADITADGATVARARATFAVALARRSELKAGTTRRGIS